MNNQIRGGKRPEECTDAMEDGIIAVTCLRTAREVEKALASSSSSSDLTLNLVSAGGKSQTVILSGPYIYLLDSENGFVQMLNLPRTTVYIQSLPSDKSCGR